MKMNLKTTMTVTGFTISKETWSASLTPMKMPWRRKILHLSSKIKKMISLASKWKHPSRRKNLEPRWKILPPPSQKGRRNLQRCGHSRQRTQCFWLRGRWRRAGSVDHLAWEGLKDCDIIRLSAYELLVCIIGIIYLFQMIQSEEDKKIVDQYKQTNVALRKQLLNLNT